MHELQKNNDIFWVPFLQNQSTYNNFPKICTYFAQISSDFARILTKLKLLGVQLHPRLLHQ